VKAKGLFTGQMILLSCDQDGHIVRLFTYFGHFLKITQVAILFVLLFSTEKVMYRFLLKMPWAKLWVIFFTSSSGHPACHRNFGSCDMISKIEKLPFTTEILGRTTKVSCFVTDLKRYGQSATVVNSPNSEQFENVVIQGGLHYIFTLYPKLFFTCLHII
jgi:hypothetical protein